MSEKMKQLNVDFLKKERYVINGDENLVLEIDTSDFSVLNRLNDAYEKAEDIVNKYMSSQVEQGEMSDDEYITSTANFIQSINDDLGSMLDELFNANVYEVFGPAISLISIKNGQFVFELIMDTLLTLYTNTITAEAKKMQKRLSKHINKYTKK